MSPKSQATKEKIDKLDLIKNECVLKKKKKKECVLRDITKKVKRQL